MRLKKKRLLFLNSIAQELITYSESIEVFSIPLIRTIPKKVNFKNYDTNLPWVITSQSAAKIINEFPKISTKIYCVGQRTASYFKNPIYPEINTALELAKLIEQNKEKSVVFFCGNKRRDDLPKYLNSIKIEVKEVIVYDTKIIDKNVNLHDYDALAFMSPSSVNAMANKNGFGELTCFAIGKTTGEALSQHNQKYKLSEEPNAASIIDAAEYFLK
jgi:uroporphyrinogen-III synthase